MPTPSYVDETATALRAELDAIAARNAALRAQLNAMRPVVEAAQAYRHQEAGGGHLAARHRALFAAVDLYERQSA